TGARAAPRLTPCPAATESGSAAHAGGRRLHTPWFGWGGLRGARECRAVPTSTCPHGCVPCCIRSVPSPRLAVRLSDHLVREDKEVRRQRQAELLGCLEVNDQRKLHGLLHREVGWRGAFQELIYKGGGTATHVGPAEPIGHEATSVHKFPDGID